MTPPEPLTHPVPQRYQPAWEEFADWCAALGLDALPATPAVVAAYLTARGGSLPTARARVSAINAAHRHATTPPPGRAEQVRRLLSPHRATRHARTRMVVDSVLGELPTHGWVRGLFGRRDAALLTLAASGLSFPRLTTLRQNTIQLTTTHVSIEGGMIVLPARPEDPHRCPVQILGRWAAVTNLAPRGYGPALLAEQLTENKLPPTQFDPYWGEQPVLTAFTANGHPAGDVPIGRLHPLHPGSAAAIATSHLSGTPPRHRDDPRQRLEPADPPPAPLESVTLDPDYHDRGVAARHAARPIFNEIDDLLASLEAKITTATLASDRVFVEHLDEQQ